MLETISSHGFALQPPVDQCAPEVLCQQGAAKARLLAKDLTCPMCTAPRFREARCGLIVNVTPLEPEWEGQVTIEISNTTPLPARIYANEGICQFLFLKGESPPEVGYADRAGQYMHQRGVALPKL